MYYSASTCTYPRKMSSDQAIFIYEDVIRGHHVYKDVWTPALLEVAKQPGNVHDRRAVALLRGREKVCVGHVPRELSRMFWYFLDHSGNIT